MEEEANENFSRQLQVSVPRWKVSRKRCYENISFHSQEGKSVKRRRCMSSSPKTFSEVKPSPFNEIASKLTPEQITNYLQKEIVNLNQEQSSVFGINSSSEYSSMHSGSNLTVSSFTEHSIFSLRQIELICKRMLEKAETEMKNECDSILCERLAEQHEAFVKFTYEMIQKRRNSYKTSYFS